MILGQGLIRSGALEPVGRMLAVAWRKSPALSMAGHPAGLRCLECVHHIPRLWSMLLPYPDRGGAASTAFLRQGFYCPSAWSVLSVAWPRPSAPQPTAGCGRGSRYGSGRIPHIRFLAARQHCRPGLRCSTVVDRASTAAESPGAAATTVKRLYQNRPDSTGKDQRSYRPQLADAIDRCNGELKVEEIQRGPGVFRHPLPDVELKSGTGLRRPIPRIICAKFAPLLGGKLYPVMSKWMKPIHLETDNQKIAEVAINVRRRDCSALRIGEARLLSR